MGLIPTQDARALFTKMLIAVYKERTAPTSFLRSFFPTVESTTKELSIEVQRGTEKIAVDVERGTEGNRNSFSRTTEKILVPPYYREFFDATELEMYDRLFGASEINDQAFTEFLTSVTDKIVMLRDKIERSYELQCSQVLETGIVTLNAGVNIDFKRKAGSKVDKGAGNYWATGSINPFTDLEAGANFLRKVGKSNAGTFNGIFGTDAINDLMTNPFYEGRNVLLASPLDAIRPPQKNAEGAVLHGKLTIGSYSLLVWTYPEYYDNAAGVSTPYVNPKVVIMLPEAPKFVLGFAAVPQLVKQGVGVVKGAFVIGDYIDERGVKHIFDIKSAGVAIPVAVDQIYTVQVVA